MRITILTYGSAGDVIPYIALAKGLMGRGHEVILGAPENFKEEMDRNGIRYQSLSGDIQAFLSSVEGKKTIAAGNLKEIMEGINQLTFNLRHELQNDATAACHGADLILGGSLMSYYASFLSEKLRVRLMFANVNPINVSTRAFPHFLVTQKKLRLGFLNALTYTLFFKALNKQKSPEFNEWRKQSGLETQMGIVHRQMIKQKVPVLQGYSPQLLPKPSDWDDHISVSGFWKTAMKDKINPPPPEDMLSWLKDREAPVYFGFGSMPVFDSQATLQMIREICSELGVRGIINAGWTDYEMDHTSMEDPVYLNRQSVDLEWLFAQCSCLVHHGGVGTTHLGIEAGIPAVICSIFADNPLWGEQFKRLNIGAHLRFKELTKDKLIMALKQIQNNETRKNAIRVGNNVKAENGLQTAVDFIEQCITTAPVYRNS